MARQKKDGRSVSFYLERSIIEKVEAYAETNGQTVTKAIERLLEKALADEDEQKTVSAEKAEDK